ncbi:MAG TPA: hypothetical protein VFP96_07200 [Candidatus Acidoferrum sp.]|nr:hypothetical protein [Candidatus Acidoferrum sp.]
MKPLPAIAPVAPVSAITTIAAATTTAASAAAMTTTPAAIAAATTSAATTAFSLRPSFIHNEIASPEILAVHGIDGAVGFFVVGDFDEGKATRLSRETVANEIDCRGIDTRLREKFVQAILRRRKRKIANIELLHLPDSFCPEPTCKSRSALKKQLPITGREDTSTTGADVPFSGQLHTLGN